MARFRLLKVFSGLQRAGIAGTVLVLAAGEILGAEWTTSKEIALGGIYTDNLFLTETDTDGAWVNLVTPGISITGRGRGGRFDFAYAPQYINYLDSEADDKFYNRLQTNGRADVVQDRFYVDGRATAGQGLIDVFGASGGDVINQPDNIQTIYTYGIAPTYQNRFGRDFDFKARYENNGVFYSEEGDDSVAHIFEIDANSGPAFGKTRWGGMLSNEYLDYKRRSNRRYTNVGLSGGYEFSRRWRADAAVGYEDNDIDSLDPDTNGPRWQISGTWTPSVRTLLSIGIGHRFFGWTPSLDFSHRSKRSTWTAGYARDLSNAATERARFDVFEFEDDQGEPISDPITGEPADVPPGTAPPSSSDFVSNTFRTNYELRTRRSRLGADAAYILRQYEDSSRDYSSAWARVFWERRLSSLTNANLGLGWYWNKDENGDTNGDDAEYTDWTFTLGITRKLTERTEVGAWYRFRDRDSNRTDDDYRENRINLAIRAFWVN